MARKNMYIEVRVASNLLELAHRRKKRSPASSASSDRETAFCTRWTVVDEDAATTFRTDTP
jgi:hypothetical protein